MPETTTIEIDGAKLTIETATLFHAWLEKTIGKQNSPCQAAPTARSGELYLGAITEPAGRTRHIFLVPGDEQKNWDDGMDWAKSKGGDLPDRIEQAMLYAYLSEEFQKDPYWSNTQHAGYSDCAWCQGFRNGYQGNYYKDNELRVRAVRREFINSVI